jgi:hypothetical protein
MKPTNGKYHLTSTEAGSVGCLIGIVGLPAIALVLLLLANTVFRVPVDGQFGMGLAALAPFGGIAGAMIGALWARRSK